MPFTPETQFPELDRLKVSLLKSGLQQKDQPLYQVINQLIDFLRKSIGLLQEAISGGTSGGSTAINQTIQQLLLDNDRGDDEGIIIPGSQGIQGLIGPVGPLIFPSDGEDGDIGAPGVTGQIGLPGQIGPPGFDGEEGEEGLLGILPSPNLPAGANTQVQFNDGGVFGGDAGLTYIKATDTLTVLGDLIINDQLLTRGVGPHLIGDDGTFPNGYAGAQIITFGSFTPTAGDGAGRVILVATNLNAEVNSSPRVLEFASTVTEAASGTHASIIGFLAGLSITDGSAATTDAISLQVSAPIKTAGTVTGSASSLLIVAAPTIGATANYALWIAAGGVRFGAFGVGVATFDANGNISSVSDERLKENITPYISGLAEIRELRPIRFNWTKESKLDTARLYTGFSAQEVLKWLPDAVDINRKNGSYSLNPQVILAALVNAVNGLSDRVEILDGKTTEKLKENTVEDYEKVIELDPSKFLIDPVFPGAIK